MRPKRIGNSIKWSLKSAIALLILASAPLVHIGKVSYGFYILHGLMEPFVAVSLAALTTHGPAFSRGMAAFFSQLIGHPWIRVSVWFSLSLSLAVLSWKYFEKPINDLKRYFPYRPAAASVPVVAQTEQAPK